MKNLILKSIPFIVLVLTSLLGFGQQVIRIDDCYEAAKQNYPLIKQKDLLVRSTEFTLANARSGYLPQFSIYGQATYQSAVTEIPNPLVEPLSKDQYKIYAEVNQVIYDGGGIKNQNALQEINNQVEAERIEVELYKINERINQLFFGTLLIDAQLVQVELLKKDLQSNIEKTESAIRNGIALRSTKDMFSAEYLKAQQRTIELKSTRNAYLLMLGNFINQSLNENTILEKPAVVSLPSEVSIHRPELTLYNYQTEQIAAQYAVGNVHNLPKLSLFVQGGYGRPGLNMLLNEFDAFYLGGIRLSWTLGGFYNQQRDKSLRDNKLQMIGVQRETFLFNTNLSLQQAEQEVLKLKQLIAVDNELIALRSSIKSTSRKQLDNGVITEHDYLLDLNAEDQAKQNQLVHEVQLMMAYFNYKTLSGN